MKISESEVLERLERIEAVAGIGKRKLADRQVAQRYDVSVRTLERWDLKPELGFPKPIRINGRRYRDLAELEAWERAQAKSRAHA
jgi:hypothetical protein